MSNVNLSSIGHVSGQLQYSVQRLAAIAAELGVQPSLTINGVPHFEETDVEKLASRVRELPSSAQPIRAVH